MGQVTNIRLDPQTDQAPIRAQTLSPKEGTPLYVHLPYCVAKCTYCDFFSVAAEGEDLDGTLAGILREALHRAPKKPRTVFLGGGTPSLYSTSELTTLLDGLDRVTGFRNSATEVTLECNPESLDEEKARALIDLGVNRLSIGVQSLRPEILKLFGRVHDAETAIAAYHSARRAGVPQVSLDVIYAAPGQDLGTWMSDLETLLALAPDHISAYHLAYEPGTLMEKWEREGGVQRQGEETELAFFTNTRARLAEAGMPGYELSNFAPKDHQCTHNKHYWANGPYVGLGPSAVSYIDGTRFGNPRSIGAWRAAVDGGHLAANWEETLSPLESLGESWWLGLRTSHGVDPVQARTNAAGAGVDLPAGPDPCVATAGELVAGGWLERCGKGGERTRIPEQHLAVADELSRRFLTLTQPR